MEKIRALFLAANPLDTERLSLDKEIREITSKIRSSEYRELVELISIWAVRPDDLLQSLNTYRPQIVHFSGHGSSSGEIILVDQKGDAKPVPAPALKTLFAALKDNIQVVILNACYSKTQAEAIAQTIDCTIGMKEAIGDEAAIAFISSFYRAIGFGRSVQAAFEQGKVALMLEGIPEEDVPVLLSRPSIDPARIILVRPSPVDQDSTKVATDMSQREFTHPTQEVTFHIEIADVREFHADVLALKYAMYLYGADQVVASALGKTDEEIAGLVPRLGSSKLLYTQGAIASERVLFINVGDLYHFGYDEIQQFATDTLAALAKIAPSVRHVAMTIHGVGYGLDEAEALRVQLAGYLNAIKQGKCPTNLERISIVERHPQRAKLLEQVLSDYIPEKRVRSNSIPSTPMRADSVRRPDSFGQRVAEKPNVFVAMPFDKEMTDLFYYGIQGPVNRAGFLCERVDLESFTGDVLQRIKSRIESATYVIAEITHSNPNVFLEVGYAWGCNRPTIFLTKESSKLPFDVRGQRCLTYSNIRDLEKALEGELQRLRRS